MPVRRRRGSTICEANPNARAPALAPAPSELSYAYVDAQKAAFKERREAAQAARDAETAAKSI